MKDKDELQPSELMSSETLKLADEMCERLSSELSLDKRGKAVFYNGAFTDLASAARHEHPVTVADLNGQPWLTLIGHDHLPETDDGLLVYRMPLQENRRFVGRVHLSRPGRREGDQPDQFFAVFDIRRDVRR
ncbi:MAG: hypothetical protein EA419_07475 [Wenzhouxiangella sp.]|nr:MAG: hypothetical protein EA419_07475 [Wenzhouxiangella sp.]